MNLLDELRQKIRDVRHAQHGLTVSVEDASSAIIEVTEGRLITTLSGSDAPDLNLSLTDSRYDTLGKLHHAINRTPGYVANLDDDANADHASIDVMPMGPLECAGTGASLLVRLFTDGELEQILQNAVSRHNPSLTPETVPPGEKVFVLQLAQAEIYRLQAFDGSKRRGLSVEPNNLVRLAESMERAYEKDVARLTRAIQSPKEANPNVMDDGDIVMATFRRTSLRTGLVSPISAANNPSPVVLMPPDDLAVEDDNVKVTWQRNKDPNFYGYELYVDTREIVERPEAGRATTSQLVLNSTGATARAARTMHAGVVGFYEEQSQLSPRFVVSRLEPETTYYFRLFISNVNGLISSSNVVRATTLPLRARFRRQTTEADQPLATTGPVLDLVRGPAGTTVTVYLDEAYGAFTADHVLTLAGKSLPVTTVGPYEVTFEVPAFQYVGAKDLVLTSPTGLVDVRIGAFTVTT